MVDDLYLWLNEPVTYLNTAAYLNALMPLQW